MKNILRVLLVPVAVMLLMSMSVSATPVSLELLLVMDVSGSIDANEFALQRTGYVNAFNSAAIQSAIASFAGSGGIAVSLVQFSSTAVQSIGWTQLTDAASASAFATAIGNMARSGSVGNNTAPGTAINFGAPLFNNNGFEGARLVMDVSGDGAENTGADTSDARDAAFAAGITINGLPIGDAILQTWYANNIVTPGGFLTAASGFDTFGAAVATKIGREIENPPEVPEPTTYAMLGAGLLALAGLKRRKA